MRRRDDDGGGLYNPDGWGCVPDLLAIALGLGIAGWLIAILT